jgi:hypothetical protein
MALAVRSSERFWPGVWSTSPCGQRSISQVLRIGIVGSVTGFGVSVSTLSGLKGYRPLAFHPARMFLVGITGSGV